MGDQIATIPTLDFNNLTLPEVPSDASITVALADLAAFIGPNEVDTYVVGVNAGVHVAASHIRQSLVLESNGIDFAAYLNDTSVISNQQGIQVANHVFQQSIVSNQAPISVTNRLDMEVSHLTLSGGKVLTHQATLTGKEIALSAIDITADNMCELTAESVTVNEKSNIHAGTTFFAAKDLHVAGNVTSKEVTTLMTQNLDLQDQATLDSKGTTLINTVNGDLSKGHIHSDKLVLHANDVDTNALINQTENNPYKNVRVKSLEVETEKNVVLSNINPEMNISVKAPGIDLPDNVETTHDLKLNATKDNLHVHNVAANNITLKTDVGNIDIDKNKNLNATDTIFIDSHQDFHNADKAIIQARNNVFVQSQFGDIYNRGEMISGHYTQIVADNGSIYNICRESTVRGMFDNLKVWQPAKMIGGNDGLYVSAKNVVLNDASEMCAIYDVNISGGSVDFRERNHSYVSYHKKSSTWWGQKDEKTNVSVQTADPVVASTEGRIRVESSYGPITSVSTKFAAKGDILLHSVEEGVILKGTITETKQYHSHDNLFGLDHNESTIKNQISDPTYVINKVGNVTIVSDKDDVSIINATVITPNALNLYGNHITVSTPILNNSYYEYSRGFNFDYPFLSTLTNYANGGFPLLSSLSADINLFSSTKNGVSIGLNMWNTAVDGVNTFNRVANALVSGDLCALLGFDPLTLHVDYTENETHVNAQSIAPNIIHAGTLNVNAKERTTLANAIPIMVDGDANINSPEFDQLGAVLTCEIKDNTKSISADISPQTLNPGLAMMRMDRKTTHFVQQVLTVGGKLTVHATSWNQRNATFVATELEKDVVSFSNMNDQDHSETNECNFQLSTTDATFSKRTEKRIGTKTESNVYAAKAPFFYNRDLNDLRDKVAKAFNQPPTQVANVFECELELNDLNTDANNIEMIDGNNALSANHHAQLKDETKKQSDTHNYHQKNNSITNDAYSTSDESEKILPENWMLQNYLSQDLATAVKVPINWVDKKVSELSSSSIKLDCHLIKNFDACGLASHISGAFGRALHVEQYCEYYDERLREGKTYKEALEDTSYEISKEYLEDKSIYLALKYLGAQGFIFPLNVVITTFCVAASTQGMVDGHIATVRESLPTNTQHLSFWEKATTQYVRCQLDQKEQENNAYATIAKKI